MNIPSLFPAAHQARFAGTGENGKPRVLIGKASYTHHDFEKFQKRDDIELVGVAGSGDEFTRLLAQKPDVVVVGSTFGDLSHLTPLGTLETFLKRQPPSEKPYMPGVVVHSMFKPDEVEEMRQNCQFLSTGSRTPQSLQYEHVNNRVDDNTLAATVKTVDPFKA